MYLITWGGRRYPGFEAVQQILLRLPVVYAGAVVAVRKEPLLALPIAMFFSPLFKPLGGRAYDWVASNRHRFPDSTCTHTSPQNSARQPAALNGIMDQ
jgi:predicted DCC family thiol-disulfide oxidoreductase YuxK